MKKSRNHNNLPTGWRKVKLGKLLKVETGRRPSGGVLAIKSGIPSIGAEHLNDRGGFNLSSLKYIPEDYFKKSTRGKIKENDILVVKDGATIGKVSRVSKYFPFFKAMVNEHVFIVRSSNENLLNQTFLFYKIFSHEGKEMIKSSISGSAQGGLKKDFLDHWETYIPPLSIQKRIADILSAFDDKIELNNKINQILEEMAQAIFKEWFVKFRFPGWQKVKFVNSELGKIPEGWEVRMLPEIFDFREGPGIRHWQYTSSGCRFINIRLIKNNDIDVKSANFISEREANGKYKHFLLQEGDIVVSTSGTLGRTAIVRKEHLPLLLNTSVIRFRPKDGKSYGFMYQFLKSDYFRNKLLSMASGSAQPNFGPVHLKQIEILVPEKNILKAFNDLIDPICKKIISNLSENQKLSALRDLLLPKLMSGEMRV